MNLGILVCLTALLGAAVERANAQPFRNLREATLGYYGEANDFTNLNDIRIGWFGPHDSTNLLGADQWWAANLAIREANDRGGCGGLPFRLVPRWAVDPWGTGVSQLARMIYDDQPLALLGSIDSASTHLAEQVVAKANLPLVSPVSTDKSVTLAGVPWMFSCAPADDAIARTLVADVLESFQKGRETLALFACTDHESRMLAREVMKEFARHGRPPDFRFDGPADAAALSGQVAALQESHADSVMVIAGPEDAARLVSAIRARLPQVKLYGSPSLGRSSFRRLAGSAAEGVRFPLLFAPDMADATTACFVERFTAEHHSPPDYTAAFAFDATRLLLEAIRRAGPNRARIREALAQLSPWHGIAGTIAFDGTGQNTRTNIGMAAIQNGPMASSSRTSLSESALSPNKIP